MKALHLKTVLAAIAASLLVLAAAPAAAGYVWNNVRLGGGGYIPNVLFSPIAKDVAYLRSDMGGVYRWDAAAKTWRALQDGQAERNWRGVESIALDPNDANIVYAAVGTYRKGPSAILRSSDRGDHWDATPVRFRMGGNEMGRDIGERLAVDPNNGKLLYFASRYDGLQISEDAGKSWRKLESFPHAGLGLPPENAEPRAGLSFVLFDKSSAADGRTQTIYVGNADPGGPTLFVSHDGGNSWSAVEGAPSDLRPIQGALDAEGKLIVTYADGMGPYMVSKGGVYIYDTKTGLWSNITPDESRPAYAGLGVDSHHPGRFIVAPLYRAGGDTIWYTVDYGVHWTSLRDISRRDVSSTPFLKWGRETAEFGWWMTGLALDPFDPTHIAYITGATVYESKDLGKTAMLWTPWTQGVEQTAILALTSPTEGPPLVAAYGDVGGYTYEDLAVSPPIQVNPLFTNTNGVDYAGRAANVIVRSGTHQAHPEKGERTASLGYSEDGGKTWQPLFAPLPKGYKLPDPIPYNFGDAYIDAPIAVSADGKTITVTTPEPVLTRDRGKSWIAIEGLPKGSRPVADRRDGNIFYAVDFDKGVILKSTDGGAHFTPQNTVGLPADLIEDKPAQGPEGMPAREVAWPLMAGLRIRGDLWFLSRGRLFHSGDGGKSFKEIKSDLTVDALSFGKAPKGSNFPALFAIGERAGVKAIWRSDNAGASWIRVNDDEHEYFRAFRCISGDPRVFGRVYVGTDGRGIVYGEPKK